MTRARLVSTEAIASLFLRPYRRKCWRAQLVPGDKLGSKSSAKLAGLRVARPVMRNRLVLIAVALFLPLGAPAAGELDLGPAQPAATRAEGEALCGKILRGGGACVVLRN